MANPITIHIKVRRKEVLLTPTSSVPTDILRAISALRINWKDGRFTAIEIVEIFNRHDGWRCLNCTTDEAAVEFNQEVQGGDHMSGAFMYPGGE